MTRALLLGFAVASIATACTKRNPDACCATIEECNSLGLDFEEYNDCGDRVCVNRTCIVPECSTAADCVAPARYCRDRVCLEQCADDLDCAGETATPHCDNTSTCVACTMSSHCPVETPVCELTTNSCRACADDTECASGVCLESEGLCADTTDVVYVSMAGSDVGDCPESAPCLTIPYALARVTAQRRVLRITSLDYTATDGISLSQDVYLDGNNTRLQRVSAGGVLSASNQARVTIERVRVVNALGALTAINGADVTAWAVTITDSNPTSGEGLRATGASLHLCRSEVSGTDVGCASTTLRGGLEIDRSEILVSGDTMVNITADSCDVIVRRTKLVGAQLVLTTAASLIENTLLVRPQVANQPVMTISGGSGQVKYNTVVGDVQEPNLAVWLDCTGPNLPEISSNIFATWSDRPIDAACPVRYSLFDLLAGAVPGTGNQFESAGAIFTDEAAGDYHPGAGSLGRGASEPGLSISEDHLGAARPQPVGTNPDIGAFEAP